MGVEGGGGGGGSGEGMQQLIWDAWPPRWRWRDVCVRVMNDAGRGGGWRVKGC